MAYLLAALAAFINALVASVLQRLGVESAPESTTLRLSLMSHAFRRGVWLIGFALSLGQFAVHATALRFGELSIVQPILTTELLFLLLILAAWFRYRLGWREWLGSLTVVVGLGGFFLAARRPRVATGSRPATRGWSPTGCSSSPSDGCIAGRPAWPPLVAGRRVRVGHRHHRGVHGPH